MLAVLARRVGFRPQGGGGLSRGARWQARAGRGRPIDPSALGRGCRQAGAHLHRSAGRVRQFRALLGGRQTLSAHDLRYAYRTSLLKERALGDVAVETVVLRLENSTPQQADGRVKDFNAQRMRTQPRILSAGSVFANPEGTYSGKLIEEAGLKGASAGAAQISEQHANFIVNSGGATACDVYRLMRQAQEAVYDRAGVWLRPEIELFGRWSPAEQQALRGRPVLSRG